MLQVNIKVIDINDNPPRFAFLYDTPTVAEDYPTGKCFFYLAVEDPDQDTNVSTVGFLPKIICFIQSNLFILITVL
jgi:hypothetical protein